MEYCQKYWRNVLLLMEEFWNGSARTCRGERKRTDYREANASVPVELTCGVPQGSICGPSQFTAYTEDIQDVITLDYHLYADDTQLIAKSTMFS